MKYSIHMFFFLFLMTHSVVRAATFTIENYLDEEMVIVFATNKIFGKTNIRVEIPKGVVLHKVDTGIFKIEGMDIFIGDRRTGRQSYKTVPRITLNNPVILNGKLRFLKNIKNEMWCEYKFGREYGQGLLVKF